MIRICDPVTNEVLERGQTGELHIGGNAVVQKYWVSRVQDADKADSCFYNDKYGHWMKTGDQATIAENCNISVVGRYKDLIIRGGKNIAPSAIEAVLTEEFGLTAQIVGVPDDVAGEIPVAVIKGKATVDAQKIREAIFRRLGKMFIVEGVILLSDLNKDDYPKTATGKVKKHELRDMVISYLREQEHAKPGTEGNVATLTRLWSKVLGIGSIAPQTSVRDYADSLVLARFSAKLHQSTGQRLSLQQLFDHPTIEEQAELLTSAQSSDLDHNSKLLVHHEGPLQIDDVSYAMGSSAKFETTKNLCQEVLKPLGLSWNDVEAVFAMQDHMQRLLRRWRPQSNNIRQTWLCRGKSTLEVVNAIKKSLEHHPVMRSMVIKQDSDVLHVIVRPIDTFFSQFISVVAAVPNSKALVDFEYDNLKVDFAADPGPMLRIFVMDIEDESCAGIVCIGQHSVFDITSMHRWSEDLDVALSNPNTELMQHVPYQLWAEHYYNLRHSHNAKQSIAWNAERLRDIGEHREALFPVARVPGWFKGNTEGWIDVETGKLGQHRPMLDKCDGVEGKYHTITLQDATELKSKFGIEIPQVLKAALAVVNTRHTGSDIALFGQYQAGRSWPFLPHWHASRMPEAMQIDGPTIQLVALSILLQRNDQVLDLLQKLQAEQAGINEHCHAPYFDLMAKLNEQGTGCGNMMEDILRRQIFNWLPAAPTEYESLETTSVVSRSSLGLLWDCSMSNQGEVVVHLTWDGAQLEGVEVENLLKEFGMVSEQLANRDNWEKSIGELAM